MNKRSERLDEKREVGTKRREMGITHFMPLHLFLFPLKTSENQCFFVVVFFFF